MERQHILPSLHALLPSWTCFEGCTSAETKQLRQRRLQEGQAEAGAAAAPAPRDSAQGTQGWEDLEVIGSQGTVGSQKQRSAELKGRACFMDM